MSKVVDFTDSKSPHDLVLVIEGEKLYVKRDDLMEDSIYFRHKFMVESPKKEIPLDNTKYEEFLVLLKVLYPPHEEIKDVNTCEFVLELGSIYQINVIRRVCDEFLASLISHQNNIIPLERKLFLADEYKLSESKVKRTAQKFIKSGGDPSNFQANDWKSLDPILKIVKEDLFYSVDEPLSTFRNTVELPYLTKFVLIAAYCASYNPIVTDGRFFTKVSERRQARIGHRYIGSAVASLHREDFTQEGTRSKPPKSCEQPNACCRKIALNWTEAFRTTTIIFIYLFFVKSFDRHDEKLENLPTVDTNDQISQLCHLGLISRVSAPANWISQNSDVMHSWSLLTRLLDHWI